ncbi:alpha/beta-hydrolase [Phellopilus nigrolimitatus]|nr:alpha/beta-hydrolase [Phellopilus nigrolimitatus]
MVLAALLPLLLLAVPIQLGATPVPAAPGMHRRSVAGWLSPLCSVKPLNLFCPSKAPSSSFSVSTPLGSASGVVDTSTVGRFAVRYASANRWEASVMATKWELPNNATDPSALPLACPQPASAENNAGTDEDCLSMILYVPDAAALGKVPSLMWIHGGSFIVGSATGPGLDGSALAQATGSIIAVVQYRLGAFGFLSPSGESNLAVKDMVTALQFLKKVLPSFNGDTSKVTIAGQSSGATMVRALLATPSASSLFRSASLHSDPMDYGFLSAGTFQTLNNFLNSQLPCQTSDTTCLDKLSTDDVLNASLTVFGTANSLDASTGAFEPMRPVMDRSFITSPLDSTAPFPGQSKTILVSTVQNEAGPTIYSTYTNPVSESDWPSLVNASLGATRTSRVVNSAHYAVPANDAANISSFDARTQLQSLGTDQLWRCPSWTFARNWASAGGKVYVAEYTVGTTYPDNADIPFCTESDTVCHEDDIEIVFGTASSPSSAQSSLIRQIQARYRAFLSGGNPNTAGYANWKAVSGSTTNAILLGTSGEATVGACDPSFWGSAVLYDYQMFGI